LFRQASLKSWDKYSREFDKTLTQFCKIGFDKFTTGTGTDICIERRPAFGFMKIKVISHYILPHALPG
jgi:hypothetical protein